MARHIIPKIQPQLIRRCSVKPAQSIKIIIEPSKGRISSLNNMQLQPKPKNVQLHPQIVQKPSKAVSNAAVSKQHLIKREVKKNTAVKYITRDVTADSINKIKQLKKHGSNKILVIIGNGPSINEMQLEKLVGHDNIHTMSINKPDQRVWPTTFWAFFDNSQLTRNIDLWNGYNGFIFNSTAIKKQKATSLQIKNTNGKGFSRDLSKGFYIGRSSVYAAMQIGMWMNYKHIYIIGCDMNPSGLNGKLHFYGVNPDVNPDVRKERFKKEAEYYDHAADVLTEQERKLFTFCSSENNWDFVNRYNKLDHKVTVDAILSKSKSLTE